MAGHRYYRRTPVRDHLADMAIGAVAGAFLALALWFATLTYWLD